MKGAENMNPQIPQNDPYDTRNKLSPQAQEIHDKVEAGREAQAFLNSEKHKKDEAKKLAEDIKSFYFSDLYLALEKIKGNYLPEVVMAPINNVLNWLREVSAKASEQPGVNKLVMLILEDLMVRAKKVQGTEFVQKRIEEMLNKNPEYIKNQKA